ncbi:hypothetical protein NDU88_003483 [Pleurodeles waltl]|uniref:Uncharacterized protein n=1 Tax=Pleurodeles waltl TaxID=8319 RepID=A0AAV7W3N6_PLEWA|nr:hypothetical protein NDU88_003483 [Pleurodeles waltl]
MAPATGGSESPRQVHPPPAPREQPGAPHGRAHPEPVARAPSQATLRSRALSPIGETPQPAPNRGPPQELTQHRQSQGPAHQPTSENIAHLEKYTMKRPEARQSLTQNDLLMVCRQLNMEGSVAEIMHQLGAHENGKISFQEFTMCRMQLVREIRKQEVELSVKSEDSCRRKKMRDRITSWPTSSENSLGALSGARESWEYDSGVRDLQSPDFQSSSTLQKLLGSGGSTVAQQAALQRLLTQASSLTDSTGGSHFELANTQF